MNPKPFLSWVFGLSLNEPGSCPAKFSPASHSIKKPLERGSNRPLAAQKRVPLAAHPLKGHLGVPLPPRALRGAMLERVPLSPKPLDDLGGD